MSFEEDLKRYLKKEKIRKTLGDNVDIRYLRNLIHSLQWISVGYSSALYFAGKKLGKDIISKQIKGSDIKSVLKEIQDLFKDQGIGKLEIVELGDKKIVLQLKECSTCYHMTEIGKPICYFESGLISGIIEGAATKKNQVSETMCGGLGDEFDEFQIKMS